MMHCPGNNSKLKIRSFGAVLAASFRPFALRRTEGWHIACGAMGMAHKNSYRIRTGSYRGACTLNFNQGVTK